MNVNEQSRWLKELLSSSGSKDPSGDTKALFKRSGKLSYILQLDEYTMTKFGDCSEESAYFIRLTAALTSRRITDRFKFGKRYSRKDIEEYICGLLLGASVETIYMLMFDESDRFIASEYIGEGTVNSSGVMPRKLIDLAVRKNSKRIILAHNHPCGSANPSIEDLSVTTLISKSLKNAEIELLAHYVISGFDINDCIEILNERKNENLH